MMKPMIIFATIYACLGLLAIVATFDNEQAGNYTKTKLVGEWRRMQYGKLTYYYQQSRLTGASVINVGASWQVEFYEPSGQAGWRLTCDSAESAEQAVLDLLELR